MRRGSFSARTENPSGTTERNVRKEGVSAPEEISESEESSGSASLFIFSSHHPQTDIAPAGEKKKKSHITHMEQEAMRIGHREQHHAQ